jgi:hypothetical protein
MNPHDLSDDDPDVIAGMDRLRQLRELEKEIPTLTVSDLNSLR